MSANRKLKLIPFSLICTFTTTLRVAAEDPALKNPSLKQFYSSMRPLFRKHYPNATSHQLKNRIHFEHDTRLFIVHEALKTGEWQDPWETRGPKRSGILCEIAGRKGQYQGAAVLPQTFDKRYFKVHVMAAYSKKHDYHIHVRLSYPRNVSNEFLKEFVVLVGEFHKHVR